MLWANKHRMPIDEQIFSFCRWLVQWLLRCAKKWLENGNRIWIEVRLFVRALLCCATQLLRRNEDANSVTSRFLWAELGSVSGAWCLLGCKAAATCEPINRRTQTERDAKQETKNAPNNCYSTKLSIASSQQSSIVLRINNSHFNSALVCRSPIKAAHETQTPAKPKQAEPERLCRLTVLSRLLFLSRFASQNVAATRELLSARFASVALSCLECEARSAKLQVHKKLATHKMSPNNTKLRIETKQAETKRNRNVNRRKVLQTLRNKCVKIAAICGVNFRTSNANWTAKHFSFLAAILISFFFLFLFLFLADSLWMPLEIGVRCFAQLLQFCIRTFGEVFLCVNF